MAIDRRELLLALGSAVFVRAGAHAGAPQRPLFMACRADTGGGASVAMFNDDGDEVFATELPARGHDIAVRPLHTEAAVFARRPGNWFTVIDLANHRPVATVLAESGRHFYGHGVFVDAGKLLIATENDTSSGSGKLGIYDATAAYRRIGEFSSHGIGPHDIALMPDGRRLLVANGGLRTDPASGRELLNRDDMEPSLALIDVRDGALLARITLGRSLKALSIRHLTISRSGAICFGCQYEGDPADLPSLVGEIRRDGQVKLFDIPDEDLASLNNYIGSVKFDSTGQVVLASSPRGNMIAAWKMPSRRFIGRAAVTDVCGIAASGERSSYLTTSGNAGLMVSRVGEGGVEIVKAGAGRDWTWDNHAIAIPAMSVSGGAASCGASTGCPRLGRVC